jgi:AraC family transcriptional regulator of adaptative response / DNA-3-methyladenine glycosylase II
MEMELDWQTCSRARIARDPRFDGKFFIAVLTTRIYCRSICPARTSKESNVRYYSTAAAAAESGFRPCLRCRPECSPGTPAWVGTPNTVSRALRLLNEEGLEEGGVESLAERLGIGARHLRRLFLKHLGASPRAVAQTRRLHFAKQLIDETSLPMYEVALASGFGCVRRFNAAIVGAYHRTPSQIRSLARKAEVQPEDEYVFRLHYRPPYHWRGMLAFLAARATPGVERVEDGRYLRTIFLNGHEGHIEIAHDEEQKLLVARVQFPDTRALYQITERIRAIFDLNADWTAIASNLKSDPLLAKRLQLKTGMRVPGCWDGFELAVRAVLGQQISVAAATNVAGQLTTRFGRVLKKANGLTHLFPLPEQLATLRCDAMPMPKKRAETVRALARAVCDGKLKFHDVESAEAFRASLCAISGIGDWTAQYVAMRALGEPDAFPSADLGLLRALDAKSAGEVERRAEGWRPWRAYATIYLWTAGHGD